MVWQMQHIWSKYVFNDMYVTSVIDDKPGRYYVTLKLIIDWCP